jgi:putative ABC transport system ATP-binding protein
MAEPLLALEAVTLTAPESRPVFRNLDWSLDRGARFRLRGGHGSGCTALLRLCAGIAEPERGRVVLDGVPLDSGIHHPFVERGALGWVPSDGGLAVNLSLMDNVSLPLRFALNQGRREAERSALALLERAGLGPRARQRPNVPGDREAWLVSMVRAAAKRSRLWLVDRPAGGLDAASAQAAQSILDEAAQDPDVTVLVVGGDWLQGLDGELRVGGGRIQSGGEP